MKKKLILFLILCAWPMLSYAAEPLRFAFQNRIGSVLPIIAVDQRFFAAEGLDVTTQMFSSGPACAEALTSGAADIATMGDTTALIALSRNLPVQLLFSHASGEQRHRVMVMNTALKSVDDLRGKRIGVKKGTSTYGGLLKLLSRNGLTEQDVRLINLRPATLIEALQAGSIDAFAASEPTPSMAEMRDAHQLTTLGGLGNHYPILIVGQSRYINDHPQQLAAFRRGLQRALTFLHRYPQQAEKIVATTLNLPPDVIKQAMARHTYHLKLDQAILTSLADTGDFLLQQKIIRQQPKLPQPESILIWK